MKQPLAVRAGMLECETICSDHCASIGKMGLNDYMLCVESCMRDCAMAKDKPAKIPLE